MRPCIGVVLGTRPEVIKLAPVVHRLRAAGWSRVVMLPSGQHGHLLRQALACCRMPGVDVPPPPSPTKDPARQVERLAGTLRGAIAQARPDAVLVQGDTATALAGASVAARFGVPVFHVEAGLRTHDLRQPYPEEGNRRAISRLAKLHFAPTPLAAANLLDEGIPADSVFVTGNTIVDALLRSNRSPPSRARARSFGIVTLHRRELLPHVGSVIAGLKRVLDDHRDLTLIVPAHPSPAISEVLKRTFRAHPRVEIVLPLAHTRFLDLLRRAAVVITDSGGVQEEAAVLGLPLVIARNVTERPEVLAGGRAFVAGYDGERIRGAVGAALKLAPTGRCTEILGDGRAAARIERHLHGYFSSRSQSMWEP